MSTSVIGRKNKGLLAIVLLLNVAAVGWYFFLFIEVKAKNERVSDLVNRIDAETTAENLQNSVKALVAQTAPQRVKLNSYVIEKDGAVSFIELLERVGDDVGVAVAIESVERSERAETPAVEELRLALKATGAWSGVVRFMGLLELLPYEARISQAALSKKDAKEDPWHITLSLIVLKEK